MVCLDRLFGADLAIRKQTKIPDKVQLMLGVIDLASKKSGTGAILLSLGKQLEGIVGGTSRAAKNSHDQMRVIGHKLFHGLGAVVDNLQKDRPTGLGHTCQRTGNGIIDKAGQFVRLHRLGFIGVEHFQKMAKTLALGLEPKLLVLFQRSAIQIHIIIKGNAVKTQVDTGFSLGRRTIIFPALDLIDGCRAKWLRRAGVHPAPPQNVNVCGVVGAGGRRNRTVFKQLAVLGHHLGCACRHQHDVHQFLFDNLHDNVTELGQGTVTRLA